MHSNYTITIFECDCVFTYTYHAQISFLRGADGQPWVWVMGEHKNDLPYAELVREGGREGGRRKRGVGKGVDEGRCVNEYERIIGVNKGRCKGGQPVTMVLTEG